jgi:hypothetical protein
MANAQKRKLYYVRSKLDDTVDASPQWLSLFNSNIACSDPKHYGVGFGRRWIRHPQPINITLVREPAGSVAAAGMSPITLMHNKLYNKISAFCDHMLIGTVIVQDQVTGKKRSCEYVTIVSRPSEWIDEYRGPDGLHWECPTCKTIIALRMGDSGTPESKLNNNLVHQSQDGALYFDAELIKGLSIDANFRDLIFIREPLLKKPLDGDVLPGDPEWDGVFRPQKKRLRAMGYTVR